MKLEHLSTLIAGVSLGSAYPSIAELAAQSVAKRGIPSPPLVPPPFNAKQQYVSNQGAHAFVAPGANDQRGPCPGLNAMANHGYFPHNGVGNMDDFVQGCFDAFGMGLGLGEFLAVYGAIFDGNLLEYSIGGPTKNLLKIGNLAGQPVGLSGSHNRYEGDVSPIRGDLYVYGNDYLAQIKQFRELYELGMQNGNSIDLDVITKYRATRFQQSISGNAYFFNAPFSGVIASPAAWSFIYRFMANHTAEHPEGYLDLETLKSFYSMTGDYPNFVYTPGHEKIPDNWYRRNDLDAYDTPYLQLDALKMGTEHPEFLSVGGNTGKVNTFVGIEPANLTDGVYNAKTLLEGNNLFCYALEVAIQGAPDVLTDLFTDITPALDKLNTAVGKFTNGFGCSKLENIDRAQFEKYPGYTKINADGTY